MQLDIFGHFNSGGEQNAKVHHAGLDWIIQYYQGKELVDT
jgi:hypothetical protein